MFIVSYTCYIPIPVYSRCKLSRVIPLHNDYSIVLDISKSVRKREVLGRVTDV